MVVSSDNGLTGVNLMSFKQTTLKNWIADLCGNDEECEQKLRNLLSQDWEVLNTIKIAFSESNIPRVQWIIKNFLTQKDIIIRTCKDCSKKNFVYNVNLIGLKCEQCHQLLLEPTNKVAKVKEVSLEKVKKNCIYCSKPVSPLPNAITCISCRNTGFVY